MTLGRQRGGRRAQTVPVPAMSDIFPSSIEESLQDWLKQRSQPDSPDSPQPAEGICECCRQPDCPHFEALASTISKLEGDARLAAEIGQSLLHKHEVHALESTRIKQDLERQLDESREKNAELEQCLVDAQTAQEELATEKNRSTWEWQKTQKVLQETAADLEAANARCTHLTSELRARTMEVDKLRIFKFMVRQADIREENLRAKLEDAKQELAVSRKTELTLESKHKKFMAKYESICSAYERLKMDQQQSSGGEGPGDLAWLKESNEKLRKDMTKIASMNLSPSALDTPDAMVPDDPCQTPQEPNQLVSLIKELAYANNKLKMELLDCRDLLSESRNEVAVLNVRLEELQNGLPEEDEPDDDDEEERMLVETRKKPRKSASMRQEGDMFSSSAPQSENMTKARYRLRKQGKRRVRRVTTADERMAPPPAIGPSPTSSTSMPTCSNPASAASVIHHHFHYHMQQQQQQQQQQEQQQQQNQQHQQQNRQEENQEKHEKEANRLYEHAEDADEATTLSNSPPVLHPAKVTLSASTSTQTHTTKTGEEGSDEENDEDSGYAALQKRAKQSLERLRSTDIRALNRRLRRAFDILELSTMSNSIIENVLADVETLPSRFLWVEDDETGAFTPLVQLTQAMLNEIGQLRMTVNDLQVEYVKKVQESDVRAVEEVMRKRGERRKRAKPTTAPTTRKEQGGALAWLTSLLFLQPPPSPPPPSGKQLIRTCSHESMHAPPLLPPPPPAPSSRRNPSRNKSIPEMMLPEKAKSQPRPIPYPALRTSRSTGHGGASYGSGSVRRSKSMQTPALEYAAVRRKKSQFLDITSSPPSTSEVDWKTFGTSPGWLGNK